VVLLFAVIAGCVAFPRPLSFIGVGEWGRLVTLLAASGGVQLLALVVAWSRVWRRLREPTMLGMGPVSRGDAAAAVAIAQENDRRIIRLIADLAGSPILLFILGVLLGTWAAVWWMGLEP